MEKTKLGPLLIKLDKLLNCNVDRGQDGADFSSHRAFVWDGTRKGLKPVKRPVQFKLDDLIGMFVRSLPQAGD